MTAKPDPRGPSDRLSIGVLMLLIAGSALGIWLVAEDVRNVAFGGDRDDLLGTSTWMKAICLAAIFSLGGLSLVGPPLLLLTAHKKPWGAGRLLWFAQGTASWLLWPPIVYHRASREPMGISAVCFYYGTPLMAVYMTLALLFGGRLNRRHQRRIARSWQELFGLLLGMAWACTGLYFIALFYRRDFFGK